MKISEIVNEATKQRLDAKCWDGKHKEGTKVKGEVRVNNCVPNESVGKGREQSSQKKMKSTQDASLCRAPRSINKVALESNMLELDYASKLDDSSFSPNLLAKSGNVDGQIEGNNVILIKRATQTAYMLMVDDNVSAFIGFENKNLKNIKNFTNAPGVIRALMGYLVHKKGMTINISQNEPLTSEGLKWLIRLIKNPRGLVIKDNAGNDVDIDELKQEWSRAKKSGIAGKTGITITENIDFGKKIRINEASRKSNSVLMPFNFYNVRQNVPEGRVPQIAQTAAIAFAKNKTDDETLIEVAAWQRKEGKNKKGGLNAKGVASYRKEHPGSKLQTAVTTKPSKLKPGSKDAKRRKSFCARMSGMKGPMKKPNGDPTRKALALKKWHCESVEQFVDMLLENMDHSKDNQAVPELKAALMARKEKLQSATEDQVYDIIDTIMTRIAKSHGISGQKLHDMWVKAYDEIPDTWVMSK